MASIKHLQLAITTDRPHDKAKIVVSCDVEFTEFEVNAMNVLGVRYTLQCHLLDMDMLYPDSVMAFNRQEFPRVPGGASTREFVTFETDATMSDLHWFIFGKDTLVAELTLKNEETGEQRVALQSRVITLCLVREGATRLRHQTYPTHRRSAKSSPTKAQYGWSQSQGNPE